MPAIADFPESLYVQESGDRRQGLVMNRTPEGTLKQRIKHAGEVVAVYELKQVVRVSVAPLQVSIEPLATASPAEATSQPESPGTDANQQ